MAESVLSGVDLDEASTSDDQTELSNTFVTNIAESVGVDGLSVDVAQQLASAVSLKLHQILQMAHKFTVHAKRTKLSTEDIDRALRSYHFEPLYGFSTKDGLPFRQVGSAGGNEMLNVVNEQISELDGILNSTVPRAPLQPIIKAHWLAIEGEQPLVPENAVRPKGPAAIDDVTEGDIMDSSLRDTVTQNTDNSTNQQLRQEFLQLKSNLTHKLSLEQQLYFKTVTEACVCPDEAKRTEALTSLRTDTGLQPLVPRFALFIAEGVRFNLAHANLAILIYMMRTMEALSRNNAITLQTHLHSLLPAVLSCMLSVRVCAKPETDNHWALRDFAAKILVSLINLYSPSISGVRARSCACVAAVWNNTNSSLAQLVACLTFFAELGPQSMREFVLPRVLQVAERLQQYAQQNRAPPPKSPAEKLQTALVKRVTHFVRTTQPDNLRDQKDYSLKFGPWLGPTVFREISNTAVPTTATSSSILGSTGPLSADSNRSRTPGGPSTPSTPNTPNQRFIYGQAAHQAVVAASNAPRARAPQQATQFIRTAGGPTIVQRTAAPVARTHTPVRVPSAPVAQKPAVRPPFQLESYYNND